jgi:hypothetical protein
MPTWNQYLQAVVLLAIGGFALVVVNSFWHILAVLVLIAVFYLWLGRKRL